jgi:hypothetical protein
VVTARLPPNREDDPNELSCQLTDGRAALLSAAAQRPDHCLVVPQTLKPGVAQKVAAKLLTSGLVREINAKSGMETWRRDKKIGQAYSLKLTAAGLKAIAAEERVAKPAPDANVPQNANDGSFKQNTAANTAMACAATAAATWPAPRQGTKIAHVVELLQRDQGVRLDELIAATGWLPHTARAR